MKLDSELGVLASVSEDRDTEWKEDIEDPAVCLVGDRDSPSLGDGG